MPDLAEGSECSGPSPSKLDPRPSTMAIVSRMAIVFRRAIEFRRAMMFRATIVFRMAVLSLETTSNGLEQIHFVLVLFLGLVRNGLEFRHFHDIHSTFSF